MDPWVPGWSEVMKGDENCQHCKTDTPDAAAVTVTLRCLAAEVAGKNAKVAKMREMREEKEHMANHGIFGRKGLPACEQRSFGLSTVAQTMKPGGAELVFISNLSNKNDLRICEHSYPTCRLGGTRPGRHKSHCRGDVVRQ